MVKDLILVIVGIVIFMIPAILQKQKAFSRAALFSGSFVTIVKLVILISEIERKLSASNAAYSDYTITAFLLMVFINFRPLLFGILLKLILLPFEKNQFVQKNKVTTESENATASSKNSNTDRFAILSPREKEVAKLAARGYSNAQIAEELFISVETVKRHMATIFEKLEIKSRTELKETK